jgi:hypothetical protein
MTHIEVFRLPRLFIDTVVSIIRISDRVVAGRFTDVSENVAISIFKTK